MIQSGSLSTNFSRRKFIKNSGVVIGGALLSNSFPACTALSDKEKAKVLLSAHLWVYASAFPPKYDATPVFEVAFSDLQHSGVDGIELMAVNLMNDNAVENIGSLADKYGLLITGTSFGGNMWYTENHQQIFEDAHMAISRLSELKGKTFGISVGNANRMKTDIELDAQADLLKKVFKLCDDHNIIPNLHNHTYEVAYDMHDLKGTLARIPDANLGPDLNWLIRGKVDPVSFIETYGNQIVFLHIRDQYEDGTWTEYVGQGVTDFPAMANALKEKNFRGHAAIELAYPRDYIPQNTMKENWRLSVEYARKVFGWQIILYQKDILNPVQPECMSFDEVHDKFGDRLSFWGTVGTQQLLPYGTPDEVFDTCISRLRKCGEKGGLVLGPTHLVEPEVPWENLMAIMEAVRKC